MIGKEYSQDQGGVMGVGSSRVGMSAQECSNGLAQANITQSAL